MCRFMTQYAGKDFLHLILCCQTDGRKVFSNVISYRLQNTSQYILGINAIMLLRKEESIVTQAVFSLDVHLIGGPRTKFSDLVIEDTPQILNWVEFRRTLWSPSFAPEPQQIFHALFLSKYSHVCRSST